MSFGEDIRTIRSAAVREGVNILGAKVTLVQVVTLCVSIALVGALTAMQRQTRMGRAMRAVAYDAELAKACGIDANKVILGAFSISSALAATAGILVALDVDMVPTMGLRPLMLGIVAMVAGGVDSIAGIALASAVLGMALHLSAWTITSEWQDAIAFAILLAFLLVRPQGFLGREIPKATV
jgi:branched-chain amino acid transport system permease protein